MKKIIAIILAVVIVAAAACFIMFRNTEPSEPTVPEEPEVSTPIQNTEPEETEPKPTTPIDPNAWNLAVLETNPEFQDVKNEEYEKDGIDLPYVFITKYHGEYRCVGQSTLRRWAKLAGEGIGIDDFAPHSFRRSCATILKDSNIPLEDISEKLNHKGSDVTKLYVKANKKKMREMQDAVGI